MSARSGGRDHRRDLLPRDPADPRHDTNKAHRSSFRRSRPGGDGGHQPADPALDPADHRREIQRQVRRSYRQATERTPADGDVAAAVQRAQGTMPDGRRCGSRPGSSRPVAHDRRRRLGVHRRPRSSAATAPGRRANCDAGADHVPGRDAAAAEGGLRRRPARMPVRGRSARRLAPDVADEAGARLGGRSRRVDRRAARRTHRARRTSAPDSRHRPLDAQGHPDRELRYRRSSIGFGGTDKLNGRGGNDWPAAEPPRTSCSAAPKMTS